MLPKMPWAEGMIDADVRPMTPFRTSRVSASREKPVPSARTAKRKRLVSNIPLRPNISATLPKKSRNEPEVKLSVLVICRYGGNTARGTHAEDAVIQVSCEVVMLRSFLMNEDTTRVLPWRKLGIATLIVAVMINRISCAVERKTAGRALGLGDSSSRAMGSSSGCFCFSASPITTTAATWSIEAIAAMSLYASYSSIIAIGVEPALLYLSAHLSVRFLGMR